MSTFSNFAVRMRLLTLKNWFFTGFLVLPLLLSAQMGIVKGVIYNNTTSSRIPFASITNLNNKTTSQSDELGSFQIQGNIGDTISILKPSFTEMLVVLTSNNDLILRLQPIIQLSEVLVKGQTKKQEMDEVRKQYQKKGSFYGGKAPPLLVSIFKPLTLLYELVGKTPGQARRFNKYYTNELRQSEIDRRFNSIKIKQITNFEGKDLQNFMDTYRPEYEKLSKWDDYSLISYIKKSAKTFDAQGRPTANVLPSLPKAPDLSEKNIKY